MFHKAIALSFKDGTKLEVSFQNGEVKQFDVSVLFDKYPQMKALEDRKLFLEGKLIGCYGIIWNDDLDLEVETVYQEGKLIKKKSTPAGIIAGDAVIAARAERGMSQIELAEKTGMDQSDISKIERGVANPSVSTLAKIAKAFEAELIIKIDTKLPSDDVSES